MNKKNKKIKNNINKNKEIREDFCGACLALPAAFAGAGSVAYTSQTNDAYKNGKSRMLWIALVSFLISLVLYLYYTYVYCEPCSRGR